MLSTRRLSNAVLTLTALTGSQVAASPIVGSFYSDQSQKPFSVSGVTQASGVNFKHEDELFYGFGGHPYFSPNTPRASFSVASGEAFTSDENHQPITVIVVPATAAAGEAANLTDLIRYYLESDDILSKDWLSTVSLSRDPAEAKGASLEPTILTAADLLAVQREYGTHTFLLDPSISLGREADVGEPSANVKHLSTSDGFHGLRGPYLTKGRPGTDEVDLLPVFKLESDTYRTFMHGVYPVPGGSFRALHAVDDRGYNLIPLPSRLYSRCKEDDGVCGQRIAVKDIYNLKGDVTSGGSRNWADLYGRANNTAVPIQRLVDLGGTIIGKTKTAMFAMGSLGNDDTVDEQYPFSARADGWQSCVGSSSGSGCTMGAYPWLDLAIGSDTTGSVRGPAATVGLYGNRPSHGIISMEGAIPLVDIFDTAGVLTRDPKAFTKFTKTWYADSPYSKKLYSSFPKRILVPINSTQNHTPEAEVMFEDFVQKLSEHLKAEVMPLDISEELNKKGWPHERYLEEFKPTSNHTIWWSWDQNGQKLHRDYAAQNGGRSPLVDPLNRELWRTSRNSTTSEDYHKAVSTVMDFRQALQSILGDDLESCSKNLLIYDFGTGGHPLYREKALNTDRLVRDDDHPTAGIFGTAGGCADTTVPIGQVPFDSKVSEIEEMKAVTASLVVHAGCDAVLADIISSLAEANILKTVNTGRTAF